MKRWGLPLCTLPLMGLALTILPHPTRAQSGQLVSIQNGAFTPDVLTITAGDYVDWLNFDSMDHTATSDNGGWDTGTISGVQTVNGVIVTSGSDDIYFNTPGTYPYHDTFNAASRGTIVVQPEGSASPSPTDTSVPTAMPSPTNTSVATAMPTLTNTPLPTATATATSTVPPTPVPIRLHLGVSGVLRVGRSTTVRISVHESDGNRPVSGAMVTLDGRTTGVKVVARHATNNGGIAVFKNVRPRRVGIVRVVATLPPYVSSTVELHVRS